MFARPQRAQIGPGRRNKQAADSSMSGLTLVEAGSALAADHKMKTTRIMAGRRARMGTLMILLEALGRASKFGRGPRECVRVARVRATCSSSLGPAHAPLRALASTEGPHSHAE